MEFCTETQSAGTRVPAFVTFRKDLRAAHVGAFARIDADLLAFINEGGHLHHEAGFGLGGLGHRGRRGRLQPGSVSTTVNSTNDGSSMPTACPSW